VKYNYWWAHDEPVAPWQGPYDTQRKAVFGAQRDGNAHRVVHVKSTCEFMPGVTMDTGHIERFEPYAIDALLRGN
jgi:hypothetical protein